MKLTMNAPDFPDWWGIAAVIARYARYADERRSADMADLFVPDGRMLIYHPRSTQPAETHEGREQLIAAFDTLHAFVATSHMLAPSEIEVDGDVGRAMTSCMAHHVSDGDAGKVRFTLADRYEDALVRVDGRWLFRERRKRTGWTERTPLRR